MPENNDQPEQSTQPQTACELKPQEPANELSEAEVLNLFLGVGTVMSRAKRMIEGK